jgi:hypothetical protein
MLVPARHAVMDGDRHDAGCTGRGGCAHGGAWR